MTYEEAKQIRDAAEADCRAYAAIISAMPKGAMGLTTDDARATPGYREARIKRTEAFNRLRAINMTIAMYFAKEARAERDQRQESKP